MSDGDDVKTRLLEAAKPHVPFDGWSEATYRAAVKEAGVAPGLARAVCPRGAIDLALAYHEAGDREMVRRIEETDMGENAVPRQGGAWRCRLAAEGGRGQGARAAGDDAVFALPHHAPDGAQAVWRTCDRIWTALGDSSDDVNWYTKRATLSGVYGSTVLYWLGDESEDQARTWEFLDRRIGDVMQFEKVKAQAAENRFVSGLMNGPLSFLNRIKPPKGPHQTGMPGRWSGPG